MNRKIFLFTAILAASIVQGQMPTLDGFANTQSLLGGQAMLYWTHRSNLIDFGLVANTSGYVAIGWGGHDANGTGADVTLASIDSINAVALIDDYKMRAKVAPGIDDVNCPNALCKDTTLGCTDDVVNTNLSRNGVWLTATFSRAVITGDNTCDYNISSGVMDVIWAIGAGFSDDDSIQQHDLAGTVSIALVASATAATSTSTTGGGSCTETSCSSCTSDTECVWCNDDSVCWDGNPNGLTITVPSGCTTWYWGQCSISGEAMGTPYTYAILVGIAVLLFVCLFALVVFVIVKLCQRRRANKKFEMEEY